MFISRLCLQYVPVWCYVHLQVVFAVCTCMTLPQETFISRLCLQYIPVWHYHRRRSSPGCVCSTYLYDIITGDIHLQVVFAVRTCMTLSQETFTSRLCLQYVPVWHYHRRCSSPGCVCSTYLYDIITGDVHLQVVFAVCTCMTLSQEMFISRLCLQYVPVWHYHRRRSSPGCVCSTYLYDIITGDVHLQVVLGARTCMTLSQGTFISRYLYDIITGNVHLQVVFAAHTCMILSQETFISRLCLQYIPVWRYHRRRSSPGCVCSTYLYDIITGDVHLQVVFAVRTCMTLSQEMFIFRLCLQYVPVWRYHRRRSSPGCACSTYLYDIITGDVHLQVVFAVRTCMTLSQETFISRLCLQYVPVWRYHRRRSSPGCVCSTYLYDVITGDVHL